MFEFESKDRIVVLFLIDAIIRVANMPCSREQLGQSFFSVNS